MENVYANPSEPDDCLLSTGTKRKQAGQNIWRMIEVSGLQYFRNCSYSIKAVNRRNILRSFLPRKAE